MSSPVMMIVPMKNGFALMPFESDLRMTLKSATGGEGAILVATSIEGLLDNVAEVYRAAEKE